MSSLPGTPEVASVGTTAGREAVSPRIEVRSRPASWRSWVRWAWLWLFWPAVVLVLVLDLLHLRELAAPPEMRSILGLIEAGRLDEAESALRRWVRYSPAAPDVRLNLARVLAARHDLYGCATQLAAVPEWSPSKPEALFREGQTWQALDLARAAEAAFRAYLQDDPNHPVDKPHRDTAEVEIINLMTLEGRWEETRNLIWSAFPRAADAHQREELLIMSMRTLLERYAPAASAGPLRRFVAADPDDFEARLALSQTEQGLKRPEAADEHIAACRRLRPAEPRVWQAWLAILKERGDLDAMRQILAQAPAEAADRLAGFRGQVLAQDGRLEEALVAFEEAVKREPAEVDLHYRLALVARRLGRKDREQAAQQRVQVLRAARDGLSDALKAFELEGRLPGTPIARRDAIVRRLGTICRDLGHTREARGWLQLASDASSGGSTR